MTHIRTLSVVALTVAITCMGCSLLVSRDEVSRVPSPNSRLDAVLFETNGGATTSFGYEVVVCKRGTRKGASAVKLYGAVRNANAYGVDMRWNGNNELVIEYLSARDVSSVHDNINVEGQQIHVLLRSGVTDPTAPSGGMLYNLRRK